jgi:hypothetical protein
MVESECAKRLQLHFSIQKSNSPGLARITGADAPQYAFNITAELSKSGRKSLRVIPAVSTRIIAATFNEHLYRIV